MDREIKIKINNCGAISEITFEGDEIRIDKPLMLKECLNKKILTIITDKVMGTEYNHKEITRSFVFTTFEKYGAVTPYFIVKKVGTCLNSEMTKARNYLKELICVGFARKVKMSKGEIILEFKHGIDMFAEKDEKEVLVFTKLLD